MPVGELINSVLGPSQSTEVTQKVQLSPQQQELLNVQTQLAQLQLQYLQPYLQQQQIQLEAFQQAVPGGDLSQFYQQQFEFSQHSQQQQQELMDLQLENIKRGYAATPQQKELINKAIDAQLKSGEIDLNRFQEKSLDLLRTELAPSRGLRPTDTPIVNLGQNVAEEALRSYGQLETGLRGAGAQAELNFPLAVGQLQGSQAGFQQQLANQAVAFQQQLQQQAFANRLQLTGSAQATLGLQTPGGGAYGSNTQGTLYAPYQNLADIGKFIGGIGSAIAGSSRRFKENPQPVDGDEVLEKLEALDVELWNYKGDAPTQLHVGPYAEDVQRLFVGIASDGLTVNYNDLTGLLIAAVKSLSARVKQLEARRARSAA